MTIAEQNLTHHQDRQYHFARDAVCPKCKAPANTFCMESIPGTDQRRPMLSNVVHFERVEASMGVGNG